MRTELLQAAAPAPILFAIAQDRAPVQIRANRKDERKAISEKRLRTKARRAERAALAIVRAATDAETRLSALIAWSHHNAVARNGIARMVAPSIAAYAAGVVGMSERERLAAKYNIKSDGKGMAR